MKKVKGWGREERRQERKTDRTTRDGRERGEREDRGTKKLRDDKTGGGARESLAIPR